MRFESGWGPTRSVIGRTIVWLVDRKQIQTYNDFHTSIFSL